VTNTTTTTMMRMMTMTMPIRIKHHPNNQNNDNSHTPETTTTTTTKTRQYQNYFINKDHGRVFAVIPMRRVQYVVNNVMVGESLFLLQLILPLLPLSIPPTTATRR